MSTDKHRTLTGRPLGPLSPASPFSPFAPSKPWKRRRDDSQGDGVRQIEGREIWGARVRRAEGQTRALTGLALLLPVQTLRMSCGCEHFAFSRTWP